jgi:polysaccharide chain length determinant protein (PEP-CTERM system associated)
MDPELEARIVAAQRNLDTLRMQYTEQHPDVISTRRLLDQLLAQRAELAKGKKRSLDPGASYSPMLQQLNVSLSQAEAQVASMRIRVEEYAARVARLRAQSASVPEVEAQLAQLNRDYLINKDNYEKLIGRREAAKLSGDLSTTTDMMTFKIIDPPTIPVTPVGPNRALLYSAVLAGAILIGNAAALLISQIRPTFLSPAELRQQTGLPVLGTVSMNWTEAGKRQRRRAQYVFGGALGVLLCAYGGVMAATLLKI